MGTFTAMGIASKSLSASKLALDLAGQNIANANTEGYSRKQLQTASDYRSDNSFGQIGNGVSTMKIMRLRDDFVDAQIVGEQTKKGFFDTIDAGLESLENTFNEPSDNSLGVAMDKFWNSWQDLSNNPADLSARESVKTNAQVMTSQFQALSQQLIDAKRAQNETIAAHVQEINNYTSEIKNINDEIANAELGDGRAANDSRDRRTLLVKKLAEIIPVSTNEDELGRISITTNGNMIVGPNETVSIILGRADNKQDDGTIISDVSTYFSMNKRSFTPTEGKLGATYKLRDQIIPAQQAQIDTIAYNLAKGVNAIHQSGYDLDEKTGVSFFNDSDTLIKDPNNPALMISVKSVNANNISLSSEVRISSKNIAAAAGGAIQNVQNQTLGIPIIPASGIISLRTDLGVAHPEFYNLVQGSVKLSYQGTQLTEGAGKDFIVDPIRGEIRILNPSVLNDPTQFRLNSFKYNDTSFSGKGNGRNALSISSLKQALLTIPDASGNNTQSLNQFYSSFIGQLGIDRNEARSNADTRSFILQQLNQRQDSIAGVSIDEEMADMIKFEHTYQASARYISTINGLFDQLMNLGQ